MESVLFPPPTLPSRHYQPPSSVVLLHGPYVIIGSNECVSIYHTDQERESLRSASHSPKSLRFGCPIGREQLARTPLYLNSCPGTEGVDCWGSTPIPSSRNGSPSQKACAEDTHQHFGDGGRRRRIPGYITRSALFKACILFLTTVQSDEVESLTAARAGAVDGREPSDALRVCDRASCIIYIYSTPARLSMPCSHNWIS